MVERLPSNLWTVAAIRNRHVRDVKYVKRVSTWASAASQDKQHNGTNHYNMLKRKVLRAFLSDFNFQILRL